MVVSTMNMGASMQYRVVGELAFRDGATPTEPGLEDSYVWLMRESGAGANLVKAF
jgi:ABC-2 type transport system ATP-binding protein